jgi:hypothetical protein
MQRPRVGGTPLPRHRQQPTAFSALFSYLNNLPYKAEWAPMPLPSQKSPYFIHKECARSTPRSAWQLYLHYRGSNPTTATCPGALVISHRCCRLRRKYTGRIPSELCHAPRASSVAAAAAAAAAAAIALLPAEAISYTIPRRWPHTCFT